MTKEISPSGKVSGKVILPGSKSMTHRALLMAALASEPSIVDGALVAEDTMLTAQALERLGVNLRREKTTWFVSPPKWRWKRCDSPIFLKNSGTSMRLLLGIAAAGKGRFIFDGTERMRQRPVGPVVEALSVLGVKCNFLIRHGYPPVEITSNGLGNGGTVEIRVDARKSSQFLSSLLIASPCAKGTVRLSWLEPIASYPYVEMTLRMMREREIQFRWLGDSEIEIPGGQDYRGGRWTVEGDCSTASYFWAAAAITGGTIETEPIFEESYQGDAGLLEILERMGCRVERRGNIVAVSGSRRLRGVDVDMNSMPDMVPTLAVVAAFAEGDTIIRNVGHLRIKESDRLKAVSTELKKMGAHVEIRGDDLVIRGGEKLHGAEIDTYDDHRIAMAFAVAGLRVPGVVIRNPGVVSKSFPEFWEVFGSLT